MPNTAPFGTPDRAVRQFVWLAVGSVQAASGKFLKQFAPLTSIIGGAMSKELELLEAIFLEKRLDIPHLG